MIIAVTGNLGTGKSTVSKLLASALGAVMLDTDHICRQQLQRGQEGFSAFMRSFGKTFMQEDGDIDRQRLRQAVFADDQIKKALEDILHPIVKCQIEHQIRACNASAVDLVIEVPLLYEVGWQDHFDLCVVVSIPPHLSVNRVQKRDSMIVVEIDKVLASQMMLSQKLALADNIIDNSGTFASTFQQVSWLARKISSRG
ncbi:MAG: dephospho-CoA kinase [Desulforhopalus sp.]